MQNITLKQSIYSQGYIDSENQTKLSIMLSIFHDNVFNGIVGFSVPTSKILDKYSNISYPKKSNLQIVDNNSMILDSVIKQRYLKDSTGENNTNGVSSIILKYIFKCEVYKYFF